MAESRALNLAIMTRRTVAPLGAMLVLVACQAGTTAPSSVAASLPQASSSAPASPSPTASPSPSATLEPLVEAPPPGSLATVLVDLRLREEPRLDGHVRTRMAAGEVVYFIGPPFEASSGGYTWRLVAYAPGYHAWPRFPDTTWFSGWTAVEGPEGIFMRALPVPCPEGPITLAKVLALPEWDRVRCFADRELTIQGQIITGFGGYVPGTFEPAWLATPSGAGAVGTDEGYLFYRQREAGSPDQAVGRIELTGHFNDPAAERCSMAVGEPEELQPKELAIMYCQGQLVVTSTRLLSD